MLGVHTTRTNKQKTKGTQETVGGDRFMGVCTYPNAPYYIHEIHQIIYMPFFIYQYTSIRLFKK